MKNMTWESQDIDAMLSILLAAIRTTLADNLIGIYLRGSLATGDFDPITSDIDFLVVTERPVSTNEFVALTAMHAQLAQFPNRYAQHLEGAYIDRTALWRFYPGEQHPTIARLEALRWHTHDYNWLLERWMVREHGVILLGPPPQTLIDAIAADELRMAVRLRLRDWAAWSNQPDDPDWQMPRSHKAYVIETMCRALYTLAHGTLVSKPQAVAWAMATLPEPWCTTAAHSRAWHADDTHDPVIVPEVMRFLRWATAPQNISGRG